MSMDEIEAGFWWCGGDADSIQAFQSDLLALVRSLVLFEHRSLDADLPPAVRGMPLLSDLVGEELNLISKRSKLPGAQLKSLQTRSVVSVETRCNVYKTGKCENFQFPAVKFPRFV